MGEVIFWTMVRIVVVLPLIWILRGYVGYDLWWTISLFAIYGIIIHPAIIHYNRIHEKNQEVIENTLCSSCEHFDESAVLCLKHDKHPTKENIPCGGIDWSPGTPVN